MIVSVCVCLCVRVVVLSYFCGVCVCTPGVFALLLCACTRGVCVPALFVLVYTVCLLCVCAFCLRVRVSEEITGEARQGIQARRAHRMRKTFQGKKRVHGVCPVETRCGGQKVLGFSLTAIEGKRQPPRARSVTVPEGPTHASTVGHRFGSGFVSPSSFSHPSCSIIVLVNKKLDRPGSRQSTGGCQIIDRTQRMYTPKYCWSCTRTWKLFFRGGGVPHVVSCPKKSRKIERNTLQSRHEKTR